MTGGFSTLARTFSPDTHPFLHSQSPANGSLHSMRPSSAEATNTLARGYKGCVRIQRINRQGHSLEPSTSSPARWEMWLWSGSRDCQGEMFSLPDRGREGKDKVRPYKLLLPPSRGLTLDHPIQPWGYPGACSSRSSGVPQ